MRKAEDMRALLSSAIRLMEFDAASYDLSAKYAIRQSTKRFHEGKFRERMAHIKRMKSALKRKERKV